MKLQLLAVGLLSLGITAATTHAGGRYQNCRGNFSSGYQVGGFGGGFYPRPFFGAPVVGFATWAPQPVVTRTVVIENRRSAPMLSDNLLARVQLRLARLGYYNGGIDGDFGPRTAQAIRLYQIENNLPVTSRLDKRTLRSLGI